MPVDPLLGVEYTYALLGNGHQYEIGSITEGGLLFAGAPLVEEAHAAGDNMRGLLSGSYNGQVAPVALADRTVVLALPSLTTTATGTSDLAALVAGQMLV